MFAVSQGVRESGRGGSGREGEYILLYSQKPVPSEDWFISIIIPSACIHSANPY